MNLNPGQNAGPGVGLGVGFTGLDRLLPVHPFNVIFYMIYEYRIS
jgi:hypothetical protein